MIPADMAYLLGDAMRWYSESRPAAQFRELVAVEAAWRPEAVRTLIAWAHRRKTAVEGERFLVVFLVGFRGPGQTQRFRRARDELRQAVEAVARGEVSALAYAERDLLVFSDPSPAYPLRDVVLEPRTYPSLGPPAPPEAAATPAAAAPTADTTTAVRRPTGCRVDHTVLMAQ